MLRNWVESKAEAVMSRHGKNDLAIDRRTLMLCGIATGIVAGVSEALPAEAPFTVDNSGALHLGPRVIPVPKSVSTEAQKFLAETAAMRLGPIPPPPEDKEGWRRALADWASQQPDVTDEMITATGAKVATMDRGGFVIYRARPGDLSARARSRIYMDIHGGGLVLGGGKAVALSAAESAIRNKCIVYGVDYRLPPDHPYPAALDDCFTAYREIIKTHTNEKVIIGGTSAGGNLAAAVVLKIRDQKLSLPAALMLRTPELDLTESGDSFQTNRYIDVVLKEGLPRHNALYANGHNLSDPYLSPLFGDFTQGFPPTFIQTGTRDLFLSNAVRMQRALRRAGVDVDLQVWEAMPHGMGDTPEEKEIEEEIGRFLDRHWGA